jgi:hypothetical protein
MDGFINMCAFADMDGDGDLDIAYDGPFGRRVLRNRLERVPGAWGRSLRVRVLDPAGRASAFGATVRLRGRWSEYEGVQTRAVDGGSAYLTQNDYVVHFGGIGDGPVWLEVAYPSVPGEAVVIDSGTDPNMGGFEPGVDFAPRVRVYQDGRFEPDSWIVTGVPAGAGDASARASIARVLPTPARASATFELALARTSRVEIAIPDVRGRRVRGIDAGELSAGKATVAWNLADDAGRALPTGVYLCSLVVDGRPVDMRRLPILR